MKDNLNGFWKDKNDTKPKHPKYTKAIGKSQKKKNRKRKINALKFDCPKNDFYSSKEWRQVRYQVIKKHGGGCMACGRSKKEHGIVIHVDHIEPRSKRPELALCFENLQLLCEDCNLGKSNTDRTDWRPANTDYEIAVDLEILNNPNSIYEIK